MVLYQGLNSLWVYLGEGRMQGEELVSTLWFPILCIKIENNYTYNSFILPTARMSEEIGWLDDIGWGEWWKEVSEADLARVRENSKKAAAAWKKKQQQAQWDTQNAKLLSLLLKYIDDEQLMHHISHQLVDMKVDPVVIVGEFLPILKQYISIDPVEPLYGDLWNEIMACNCRSVEEIVTWYRVVFKSYDELQDISVDEKIALVKARCDFYGFKKVVNNEGEEVSVKSWLRGVFG